MAVRDKADEAVDTGCIDKESNAVSGRHGRLFGKVFAERDTDMAASCNSDVVVLSLYVQEDFGDAKRAGEQRRWIRLISVGWLPHRIFPSWKLPRSRIAGCPKAFCG